MPNTQKSGGLWKGLVILLIGTVVVAIVAEVAKKISTTGGVDTFLNNCYTFLHTYQWEFFATLLLIFGIWFSLVRRRIYISILFLVASFVCAFILPFVNLNLKLF